LPVKLIHIPGETTDHIGVWIPSLKTFLSGDDIYPAFPNLYTIRGAEARNLIDWYSSLDTIRRLQPELLVPSHGFATSGVREIGELLTVYRDAIQFVHDQTVRYMNDGLYPDDIIPLVKLPAKLAKHPYLGQFYGTVAWSVKGVFQEYLGWFSGDPVDLSPMTTEAKALRMVELAGGMDNMVENARRALGDKDYQWALELTTHALRVDTGNDDVRRVKLDAMAALAARQTSSNGRNYYLTAAMEEAAELTLDYPEEGAKSINQLPIQQLFDVLPTRFKPETCGDRNDIVVFEFKDSGKIINIYIRNSVAVVDTIPIPTWDIKVTTKEHIWREVLINKLAGIGTYASGDLSVDGGIAQFKTFLDCFTKL
jgi:alkyl sulfatase BDS1-like metallo-beta-lactamase superfamily hydrolase